MRQKFKWLLLIITLMWLAGCATPQSLVVPSNPSNPIKRVAILPMLDNSDDVEAVNRIREDFYNRLGRYHYDIQPLAETNELLNFQMGITMGKQYDMATPQEIGKTLGVDGVFYGYLLDFEDVTVGVSNIYSVRMGWKLVDTKTGKITWGKGVAVRRTESVGGVAALGDLAAANEVDPLPGSSDPMNEMPGLNKWISMGNKSVGVTEGVVGGLIGKIAGRIGGNSLQGEIKFAHDRLFTSMLAGPASK